MAKKTTKIDTLLERTTKGDTLVNVSARIPASTLQEFNDNNYRLNHYFGQKMPLKRVIESAISEAIQLQKEKLKDKPHLEVPKTEKKKSAGKDEAKEQ